MAKNLAFKCSYKIHFWYFSLTISWLWKRKHLTLSPHLIWIPPPIGQYPKTHGLWSFSAEATHELRKASSSCFILTPCHPQLTTQTTCSVLRPLNCTGSSPLLQFSLLRRDIICHSRKHTFRCRFVQLPCVCVCMCSCVFLCVISQFNQVLFRFIMVTFSMLSISMFLISI